MNHHRTLAPLFPLLALCEDETIELPEPLARRVAQVDRLAAGPADPEPVTHPADLVRRAVEDGTPLPTVAEIAETTARVDAGQVLAEAIGATLAAVGESTVNSFHASADSLIVETLRPVHSRIVDDLRAVLAVLDGHGLDPAGLLDAASKVRQARRDLDTLAAAYNRLRAGHGALVRLAPPTVDDGRFSELRNGHEPPFLTPPGATSMAPTDPAARLAWMLGSGGVLWMATPAERDARWAEVYPPAVSLAG
ncbi:MAG: hypothetical protein ACR2JF_06260 [Iamia sp.]